MDGYRIDRLPDGWFVVSEANQPGRCVFGCAEIDDALGYLKDKWEPEKAAGELKSESAPKRCPKCGSAGVGRFCTQLDCVERYGHGRRVERVPDWVGA